MLHGYRSAIARVARRSRPRASPAEFTYPSPVLLRITAIGSPLGDVLVFLQQRPDGHAATRDEYSFIAHRYTPTTVSHELPHIPGTMIQYSYSCTRHCSHPRMFPKRKLTTSDTVLRLYYWAHDMSISNA